MYQVLRTGCFKWITLSAITALWPVQADMRVKAMFCRTILVSIQRNVHQAQRVRTSRENCYTEKRVNFPRGRPAHVAEDGAI